jgi:CRISPR-associated Csx2 family protein
MTFVGQAAKDRAYKSATYRFPCGFQLESKLFAVAALSWLRSSGKAPSRVIVIGTPTSGWDVLMELVLRFAPTMESEALAWAIDVSESLARGPIDPSSLRAFECEFSKALGVQVNLVLATNDGECMAGALSAALEPGEQVVLDITHSFRSMPVHALLCLGALRWIKGIELVDVLYGSWEERGADGVAPARSLGATARLAHATPALAQLELIDDVGAVAPYLAAELGRPAIETELLAAQRLESIMQFDSAQVKRGQVLGQLRQPLDPLKSPITASIAARMEQTLSDLNLGSGSLGLRNRAARALERGDFMRTLALANEALTLKVIELRDLRRRAGEEMRAQVGPRRDFYQVLNRLARESLREHADRPEAPRFGRRSASYALKTVVDARNAVMHAGANFGEDAAPDELLSPDALRALLEWSIRFYDHLR